MKASPTSSASQHARIVVAMCAATAGLSYSDRVNLSVAVVTMARALGWTAAQRATVLSAFFWGYLASQTLGAALARRNGGGKRVLAYAGVLWSVCTVAVPWCARAGLWPLVMARVALGLAEGVTFPVIYYMLREWVFEDQRSSAVAAVSLGTLAGAIFSFVVTPHVIASFGWEAVFYVFGGILGPIWFMFWMALVPADGHSTNHANDNGDDRRAQFHPEVEDASPPPPPRGQTNTENNPASANAMLSYLSMLRHPVLVSIVVCHFAHNIAHFALLSWLPTLMNDALGYQGESLAIASLPWMVMSGSVFFSSNIADAAIARRLYPTPTIRRFCTVVAFTCAGFCMIGVALAGNAHPRISLVLLSLGLAANGAAPSAGYESAKLDVSRSALSASRLQSLSNSIATFAGIVGVPLVAALRSEDGRWTNVFLFIAATFFASGAVFHRFGRWSGPIM